MAAVLEDIAYDLAGACRLTQRRRRPPTYHRLLAPGDLDDLAEALAGAPELAWAA